MADLSQGIGLAVIGIEVVGPETKDTSRLMDSRIFHGTDTLNEVGQPSPISRQAT